MKTNSYAFSSINFLLRIVCVSKAWEQLTTNWSNSIFALPQCTLYIFTCIEHIHATWHLLIFEWSDMKTMNYKHLAVICALCTSIYTSSHTILRHYWNQTLSQFKQMIRLDKRAKSDFYFWQLGCAERMFTSRCYNYCDEWSFVVQSSYSQLQQHMNKSYFCTLNSPMS